MRVTAFIDRFEGSQAVLLFQINDESVVWPRHFLPEAAKEGDIINLDISVDHFATEKARQENAELLKQLTENDKK